MDTLTSQMTPLLLFLLPGFVSAWVFYALTSHPKPSQFERTVEALVFTAVVHAGTAVIEAAFCGIGRFASIAPWTTSSQTVCSMLLAGALGACISRQQPIATPSTPG